jgi:microcystin-dependent protein
LGSKADLSGVDFNRALYLELTIDANNDGQITAADPPTLPRQVILPAIFATESANSRLLASNDWSALLGVNDPVNGKLNGSRIQPNSVTSLQIASNTITATQIAPSAITGAQIADSTITLSNLAQQVIQALNPAGTIVAFGGQTNQVPTGWLLCDGSALSRATFSNLFAAIGTAWGAENDTSFRVPDLRGLFLRGVALGRTDYDPDVNTRIAVYPGGSAGNNAGSFESDDFKSHNHLMTGFAYKGGGEGDGSFGPGTTFTLNRVTAATAGGTETHPKNAYVNYIIKY